MINLSNQEDEKPIDAKAEEARVLAAWPEAWAQAVGLETAFLSAQPHLKNQMPTGAASSRAWTSDRTWEMATRALAASIVHGLNQEDTDTYVSAFIGQAAYSAFAAFIESADLPKPADLLDGKVTFTHSERLDRSAAVIGACTALVTPKNAVNREARATAFYKILESVGDSNLDLVVPSVQAMISAGLHTLVAGLKILAKCQPVITAANNARK